ncbi:MAG: hypothetical protein Q9198_001605 [Flavoplaca austrocitrina]
MKDATPRDWVQQLATLSPRLFRVANYRLKQVIVVRQELSQKHQQSQNRSHRRKDRPGPKHKSRSTEPEIFWPFTNRHDDKKALQSFFCQNGCHYRTPTGVMSAFCKARAKKYDELYDLLLDGLLVMLKKETSMETWRITLGFWVRIRKPDPLLNACLYKAIKHFRRSDKLDVDPSTGLKSLRNFLNLLDWVEKKLEKDIEAETASYEIESSENER